MLMLVSGSLAAFGPFFFNKFNCINIEVKIIAFMRQMGKLGLNVGFLIDNGVIEILFLNMIWF